MMMRNGSPAMISGMITGVILLTSFMLSGCATEEASGKTSLFEDHHDIPAHAPRSLADLSHKIRERLQQLESSSDTVQLHTELADLIGWSAEVAADTELSEADWLPIYQHSEPLRKEILEQPDQWNEARIARTEQLCQLLDGAWESLPPEYRTARYLGHEHEHDHEHEHEHEHEEEHEHGHEHEHDST